MVLCTRLHGRQGRTSRVDSQTRDNYAELLHVALVAVDNGDFIPGGVCFSPPFTMQAVGVLTLCTTSLYEACKNVRRSICQGVWKRFSPEAPLIAILMEIFCQIVVEQMQTICLLLFREKCGEIVAILGQEVAVVEEFVCLSSLVQSTTQSSPDISHRNAITHAECRQPNLEVKNCHFNQAEAAYHLHSTYLPVWLWVLGSHQERCTQDWCPRSVVFAKVVRNQEQNG